MGINMISILTANRIKVVLLTLVLTAMACALPIPGSSTAKPTPAAANTTQAATQAAAPDATAVTPTGSPQASATPAAEPPPPPDWISVQDQNLQSKKWSEGQGLLLMMQLATGEKTARDVFTDQPVQSYEATELTYRVNAYLAKNKNAPEKDELTRLLSVLTPDSDAMLKYAAPESKASLDGGVTLAGNKLPAPLNDEVCTQLWKSGFPAPNPGETPPVCLLYKTFQVLGKTYRVFYPKDLTGSAATPDNVSWLVDSLTLAAQTYKTIGGNVIPDTDVVYGVVPGPYANANIKNNKCRIYLYPTVSTLSEAWFKQVMAHELFHCYQNAFFKSAFGGYEPGKRWWIEGTADYFGNVVYPATNMEWREIKRLDNLSNKTSIFDMKYENVFFFMYMASRAGGPEGVLGVLGTFTGADAPGDYAAGMAKKIPNLDEFFHAFGHAYLDGTLVDTGGGAVPFNPQPGDPVNIQGSGSQPLSAAPFTLTRYTLLYAEGNMQQTVKPTGKGLTDARTKPVKGPWTQLPGEVMAKCGEQDFLDLVTTTTTSGSYISTLDYSTDPKETDCDKCLVGSWTVNADSYTNYLTSTLGSTVKNVVTNANQIVTFSATGFLDATYAPVEVEYTLEQTDINNKKMDITMNLTLNGDVTDDYTTQNGVLYLANSNPNIKVDIMMNGSKLDSSTIDSSKLGSWTAFAPVDNYTCKDNTLTITPQLGKPVQPLIYTKVGK